MASCDLRRCDGDENLPNQCNFCGGTYCSTHRLPESHGCDAVNIIRNASIQGKSKIAPKAIESPTVMGTTPEPDYEGSPDVDPDGGVGRDASDGSVRTESQDGTSFWMVLLKRVFLPGLLLLLVYYGLGGL